MIQEDKELLLKDLCARLPYGTKTSFNEIIYNIDGYAHGKYMFLSKPTEIGTKELRIVAIEDVKPYLFPMSSMTNEQEIEYLNTCISQNPLYWTLETFYWLTKNHFDYNYLIDNNLAIDATGLNIY